MTAHFASQWRAAVLALLFYIIQIVLSIPLIQGRPETFQLLSYSEFQISDGVGGDAEWRAHDVFGYAFMGADLSSVPYRIYDAVHVMREAVEDADVESFVPLINQKGADTDDGQALAVGRVKNQVLWYTASVLATRIKIAKDQAQGLDTEDSTDLLDTLSYLLDQAIAADRSNSGLPSQSVEWPS